MFVRHVACLAPPRLGGMGAAALRWSEGLAERGHQVELVVPATGETEMPSPLIRPWPAWLSYGNAAVLRHPGKLFEGIDVLHLHYPFYGTAEPLLFRAPPKPVVVTFHMDAAAGDWRDGVFAAQRRLLQPRLFRHASALLASSFDYLRASSAAASFAAEPARWHEVPLFVDEAAFRPAARSPRSPEAPLRALFVGALDRAHLFKGLPVLFKALAAVPGVDLTVVGDGDARAAYEAEASAAGLARRMTFVGRLSQETLIQAYQRADVLVFPSTSRAEAFGLVALEAQACGTPVIAADLPGVRTVVRHEETGLLIEPGSVDALVRALRRLQADPAWAGTLGRQARHHVEARFCRRVLLDRLETIYRDVCASP